MLFFFKIIYTLHKIQLSDPQTLIQSLNLNTTTRTITNTGSVGFVAASDVLPFSVDVAATNQLECEVLSQWFVVTNKEKPTASGCQHVVYGAEIATRMFRMSFYEIKNPLSHKGSILSHFV